MSETEPSVIKCGASCAKELLCLPPAYARAQIEALKSSHAAMYKRMMKEAMLKGLADVGAAIRSGTGLSPEQMWCYHSCTAVLDDWKLFEAAYDALRESLIDSSVKG